LAPVPDLIVREKSILLIASGIFHPPLFAVRRLRVLINTCAQRVRMIPNLEAMADLDLNDVGAIVLYFHRREISERALNTFEDFVREGGGVLAIHSATASFKQSSRYFEILGGRFVGHGKVAPFDVKPVTGPNEPFSGIGGFQIRDEIYLHDIEPDICVHFETSYQGAPVPVVWTYHYGAGRVCYAMLGHGSGALKNPTYQEILTRGLGWVTNGY